MGPYLVEWALNYGPLFSRWFIMVLEWASYGHSIKRGSSAPKTREYGASLLGGQA